MSGNPLSDKVTEKNAVIKSVRLDRERGLSAWVMLDYGGTGQGFGGYQLYIPQDWEAYDKETQANYAGHFIYRVLEVVGVDEWSKIPGKTVRVRSCHSGVVSIGHIVKDDWFNPRVELDKLRKEVTDE